MASFCQNLFIQSKPIPSEPKEHYPPTGVTFWPSLIPGERRKSSFDLDLNSTFLPWYNPPGDTISHRGRPPNVCSRHQGSSRSFMYQWRDTRILPSIKDSYPRIPPQLRFWQCYHNHPPKTNTKKKYTNSLLVTQCLCENANEKASPEAIMPYFKQPNSLYTKNYISLLRWICIHLVYKLRVKQTANRTLSNFDQNPGIVPIDNWRLYGSNPVHFYWTQGASKSSLNSFTQVCSSPVHRCARQYAKYTVYSKWRWQLLKTTKNKNPVSICP